MTVDELIAALSRYDGNLTVGTFPDNVFEAIVEVDLLDLDGEQVCFWSAPE